MPAIAISELKNPSTVSALCHEQEEPVVVTKNGHEDMVIVTPETWREARDAILLQELALKLAEAEADIASGRVVDYEASTRQLREEYGL